MWWSLVVVTLARINLAGIAVCFLEGQSGGGRGSRLSIAASTQRFWLHVKFSTSSSVADGKREEKKGKVSVGDVEDVGRRRGGVKDEVDGVGEGS